MCEIIEFCGHTTNAVARLAQVEDNLGRSRSEKPAIKVVTRIVYTKSIHQAMRNLSREE